VIPKTQTRVGKNGNCFATALASILETKVPEFGLAGKEDDAVYWQRVDSWLAKQGLQYKQVPIGDTQPVGFHTIEGVSPRGGMHACVAYNGKLVHDPHPVKDDPRRGLVKPMFYGLLLPLKVAATDVRPVATTAQRENLEAALRSYVDTLKYPHVQRDKKLKAELLQNIREIEETLRLTTGAKDRADMMQLRRNTQRQGGPFHVQLTEPDGHEHTTSVHALKAYDWYGASKAIPGDVQPGGGCAACLGSHPKLKPGSACPYRKKTTDEVLPVPPLSVGDTIKLANGKKSKVRKITLAKNLLGEPEWHVLTTSGDVVTIRSKEN